MRRALLLGWLVGIGLAGGCRRIDQGSPNDDPPSAGQREFDRDVYPILRERCAGCHGDEGDERVPTRFVASDEDAGYMTAAGFYALTGPFTHGQAPILRRIDSGDHAPLAYTAAERATIQGWLDLELALRLGSSEATAAARSPLVEQELARYRGCMTRADFEAANMVVWATLPTETGATCEACHADGDGGFLATTDVPAFYDALYTRLDRFLPYFTVDVFKGGQYVAFNFGALARVANADDPHRDHPRFESFANPGIDALRAFDSAILSRINDGTCEPSPFPLRSIPSADR